MQTFLPYSDFEHIAKCLDYKRLNKQILEADTLIDLIEGVKDNSWKNHPACKMWMGYSNTLRYYRNIMLYEWIGRKYKSNRQYREFVHPLIYPSFLFDDRVILSHRSNLVRKLPEHYSQFGWKNYGLDGYYWPCEVKTKRSVGINNKWDLIVKELNNE